MGVSLLILSLVHTPLPQPDFHNIRHHDAPGEVCTYHDHLLRWHPGAGTAEDVAVLHWHWFVASQDDPAAPDRGHAPAWHAHAPDWPVSTWNEGPRLAPAASLRVLTRSDSGQPPFWLAAPDIGLASLSVPGSSPPQTFGATFARRVSRAALLQRWTC